MQSIVSVILTTRNRVNNLQRCLKSLQCCQIPVGWEAEVLVVDNGCGEETRNVVEALSQDQDSLTFRYLCEPRKGKTYAVNHGTGAARGKIFAFLDDDVMVDKMWLVQILAEFDRD